MVTPAMADMEVEATYGRLHRWKHYVGICLVPVHALAQDLRSDAGLGFDLAARGIVWKPAALWFAVSVYSKT